MSSPNLASGARSFVFTTTRGKRCTAILKVAQSSNVRTTTSTTEATTREEVTEPTIPSTSLPPLLEDTIFPGSTSATSTPATTSIIAITSTFPPFLSSSTAVAEESSAGQESSASQETSATQEIGTSLGASFGQVTASEIFPDDAVTTPFASTVPNFQPSSANNAEQATETPIIIPTLSSVSSTNSNCEAAKVAGGVFSGLVVLSVIGLFFWLWRRRRVNKRRSTLLTPLGPGPHTDPTEKAPYIISRRSIGPTSLFVKVKAALGYNVKKIRERISQTSLEPRVRLSPSSRPHSRGLLTSHGRNPSSVLSNESNRIGSLRDSIANWWSRVMSHIPISKRLRIRGNDEVVRDRYTDMVKRSERKTSLQHQRDFLTLLAMDGDTLGREPGGQGQQLHKAPTLQLPHLNENDNPFRVNNTLSHISAIPAPLASVAISGARSDDNPFRDPLPQTTTDRRRRQSQGSRGQSISAKNSVANNPSRQPSIRTYRESIDSFTAHRNKFLSDPFDLERSELLGGVGGVTGVGISRAVGVGETATAAEAATATGPIRHPPSVHTRQESLGGGGGGGDGGGSSRYSSLYSYSSGVVSSLGDDEWNDPGPDVGPVSSSAGGYSRVRGASVTSAGKFVGRAI